MLANPIRNLGNSIVLGHRKSNVIQSIIKQNFATCHLQRAKPKINNNVIIEAKKENIDQSPWKMNFLVKLVRGLWLPDALAQLKFSPKHRAVDVGKIISRAVAIAKTNHDAIAEELKIDEIFITKGMAQKRMRIMGRGRTGIGYKRKSHVVVKVAKINFEEEIAKSKSLNQAQKWRKRLELVNKIKSEPVKPITTLKDNTK